MSFDKQLLDAFSARVEHVRRRPCPRCRRNGHHTPLIELLPGGFYAKTFTCDHCVFVVRLIDGQPDASVNLQAERVEVRS